MQIRTRLRDRKLPNYSRSEEIFHMVSHIVGGVFAIAVLAACVGLAAARGSGWALAGGIVYGGAMVVLYAMSSIYHGLSTGIAKKVFQILDHCAVFVLIAGSYTPILLAAMRERHPAIAWSLFGFVWGATALCVSLNAVDLRRFQVFSMIGYIGLGWILIFFTRPLLDSISVAAYAWMLAGGVLYTIGSVLYMIGKKRKWMHAVFHIFVVMGSVGHFVCVCLCIR